ncbi:MAG TPA: elongation factor P [Candidatus Polarisedimenticolia bacterium]|jgi:elongation factor P|nr:elongation factor P [Candidatus Polarisedimenticolia bacterium]
MLTTSDFKKGLAIQVEGLPYIIMEYSVQTPSARGSATLVRIKGRNVITGQVLDMTFKSGDKFEEPDLERRKINFMYADGDDFHFMDEESYEQFHMDRRALGETVQWLREGVTLRSIVFEGRVVGVELPQFVELKVIETGPGGRSDMASGKVTKAATLENGTEIRVPVYLAAGETVIVDTGTGEFVKRVGK